MDQTPTNVQPKEKRVRNFNEVSLGMNKKVAMEEAQRYGQIAASYSAQCPLGIDIPGFIALVRENKVSAALNKIYESSDFPLVCGRVCLAPCEAGYLSEKGDTIAIRALERFVADHGSVKLPSRKNGSSSRKKVAIVGSGPSGLAAAMTLAKNDFDVVVFESFPQPGGVLRYGIPGFRLPKEVLEEQIRAVRALGVQILTDCHVGKAVAVKDFFQQGFGAVLLTTGSGSPYFPQLPGIEANGVYGAKEFLLQLNFFRKEIFIKNLQEKLGRRIVILGSGSAALDCGRMLVRLGRDVTMVFENLEEDLRIHSTEIAQGKEEGVKLESLAKALEIVTDEESRVKGLKIQRLDYADPQSNGQWQLITVPDSEFVLDADAVIVALGDQKNSSAKRIIPEISCDGEGRLAVDSQTGMTTIRGVFSAGDVATAGGTIVDALASGKKVGEQIARYLQDKK